eukprot:gene3425-3890_t
MYKGVNTKFINIKIPNAGFIYKDTYVDQEGSDTFLDQADGVIGFFKDLESVVPFSGGFMEVYYKQQDQRFEVYFQDDSKIFTIKFLDRTYERAVNHRRYTRKDFYELSKSKDI